MFGKKGRSEDRIASQEINIHIYLNKQVAMLTAASHAAEVSELRQKLEERQGMQYRNISEMSMSSDL